MDLEKECQRLQDIILAWSQSYSNSCKETVTVGSHSFLEVLSMFPNHCFISIRLSNNQGFVSEWLDFVVCIFYRDLPRS